MTYIDAMVEFITTAQPPATATARGAAQWPAVGQAVSAVGARTEVTSDESAVATAIGCAVAERVAATLDTVASAERWSRAAAAGVVGAGAALGRLMNLDDAQLRHLVGLCATQAAGLREFDGTDTGELQVRKAAADALEAALLVSHGFTSSADGMNGRRGLFALMAPGAVPVPDFGWA